MATRRCLSHVINKIISYMYKVNADLFCHSCASVVTVLLLVRKICVCGGGGGGGEGVCRNRSTISGQAFFFFFFFFFIFNFWFKLIFLFSSTVDHMGVQIFKRLLLPQFSSHSMLVQWKFYGILPMGTFYKHIFNIFNFWIWQKIIEHFQVKRS